MGPFPRRGKVKAQSSKGRPEPQEKSPHAFGTSPGNRGRGHCGPGVSDYITSSLQIVRHVMYHVGFDLFPVSRRMPLTQRLLSLVIASTRQQPVGRGSFNSARAAGNGAGPCIRVTGSFGCFYRQLPMQTAYSD